MLSRLIDNNRIPIGFTQSAQLVASNQRPTTNGPVVRLSLRFLRVIRIRHKQAIAHH